MGRQNDKTPFSSVDIFNFRSSEWMKVLALLLITWAAIFGLYFQTAFSLVETWSRSDTYGHGFLIFPLSGYLVWRERHRLAALVPEANLWALLLLAGSALVWFLGHMTATVVVQQMAWVTMVAGMVWAMTGTKVTQILLFPLLFLFFAVPVGADLVPLLQNFTAFFTVTALQASGVPVFWEGLYFTTPSGSWHVAESCAGIRYLISGTTLGVFFAGIVYRNWTRRVAFVLAAGLTFILANGVRAYGIALFGYLVDHQLAASVDHLIYGWLFFIMVMFPLFWVGMATREPSLSFLGCKASGSCAGDAALPLQGKYYYLSTKRKRLIRMTMTAVFGVGIVALIPMGLLALPSTPFPSLGLSVFSLEVPPPWQAMRDYAGNWNPELDGADTVLTRTYTDGYQKVHLFLAVYAQQQQGSELVSQTHSLRDKNRWALVTENRRETFVENDPLTVKESHLRSGMTRRLVWSWYWLGGHMTSSDYMAKFLQATANLLGWAPEGALIALAADYRYSPMEAVEVLENFLQHTSFLQTTNPSPKM